MLTSLIPSALPLLLLLARTATAACDTISYTSCADNIVHWYNPNTGEVCDPHDCGGGRAPPRTDVPGCPLYSGTVLSTTVSYLSCWTPSGALASSTPTAVSSVVPTTDAGSIDSITASSTTFVDSSTLASAGKSASGASTSTSSPITSAIPSATPPASLSTKARTTGDSTLNTTSPATQTKSASSEGNLLKSSLTAVIAVVVGAIALL